MKEERQEFKRKLQFILFPIRDSPDFASSRSSFIIKQRRKRYQIDLQVLFTHNLLPLKLETFPSSD